MRPFALRRGTSAFGRMLFTTPPPPKDITAIVHVSATLTPRLPVTSVGTVHVAATLTPTRIVSVDVTNTIHTATTESGVIVRPVSVLNALHVTTTAGPKATYSAELLSVIYVATPFFGANTALAIPGLNQNAETWVVNMDTKASSQFDGYGFNSYGFDGTDYWACSEDGIYKITGTTDQGSAINSLITLAKTSFGTQNLKHLPDAWIGASSGAPLTLNVTADGVTYTYQARDFDTTLEDKRVDVGRGLLATYYTLELVSSTPTEVDSIEVLVNPRTRPTTRN